MPRVEMPRNVLKLDIVAFALLLMSAHMGAQWKHAGQVANANKKGQIVGKLTKEIAIAAKLGGPNPEGNFRLRGALEAAR